VIRIGPSLAAILYRLAHLVLGLLQSDRLRVTLRRKRDVGIFAMLVVCGGCARIQTGLLEHELAGRV